MTAAEMVAAIEDVRDVIVDARTRVEVLDADAFRAGLHNGQVLPAAAGGLTCVLVALHEAQRLLQEYDRD